MNISSVFRTVKCVKEDPSSVLSVKKKKKLWRQEDVLYVTVVQEACFIYLCKRYTDIPKLKTFKLISLCLDFPFANQLKENFPNKNTGGFAEVSVHFSPARHIC